jgi:MFS family permease
MKMKNNVKTLIGIYSGSLCLMGLIVPVSVLAQIAMAFPDVPITTVQMMVALPSLVAVFSGLFISKFAHKIYKKHSMIFFTCLYMISGMMPVVFHANMTQLLISAALVGVSMGGLQNPMTSIIPDYFEGQERATALGFLSTFICLGGIIYTFAASRFGASDWTHAFYAYGFMFIFLIGEIIFLPSGKLEPKASKSEPVKVPVEVIIVAALGFIFYTCYSVFNSNEALLIAERGIGGTVEAGYASTACTAAGILAGIITGSVVKFFKKYAIPVTFALGVAGLALCYIAGNVPVICIGAFILALGYQTFTPLAGIKAAEESGPVGMAFNMALVNAVCSFGQALSPYTTSIITKPWGSTINSLFMCATIGSVIISVIAFVHYGKGKAANKNQKVA